MYKLRRRLHHLWRLLRIPFWSLAALIGVLLIAPLLFIAFTCVSWRTVPPQAIEVRDPGRDPVAVAAWSAVDEHVRPADQTYLTFPEWYIVFSADEYAAHVATQPPSRFPFFGSVWQYWRGYAGVCAVTKENYAFNSGYHLMLYVIGTSFTVENGIKGLYEGTIGRLTEWLSTSEPTAEDRLARQYAKEYGDFIHAIPWFDFPYGEKLQLLWSTTGLWGPNPIRKWERKLALSTEFIVKAGYGALIGWGNTATYGAVDMEIYTVATGVTDAILADLPDVHLIERIDNQYALITIPHYEPFTALVPELARRGVRFVEFAGNDQIMVSAFAPRGWTNQLPGTELMFAMDVLIDPTRQRVGLNIPVAELHSVLAAMAQQDIIIEHLYDY